MSEGLRVINYIDDYVRVGVPDVARTSFASLFNLMKALGLTISDKKLVAPSTQVICLGVLINTEDGTISIPPNKLHQINDTVNEWLPKKTCTKSVSCSPFLVAPLCPQMCETSLCLLNRMLALLRSGHASQKN